MEGDTADDDTAIQLESAFLSTPSGWRATLPYRFGRRICEFLSTPSGWRATAQSFRKSIALRLYFYPRPPGGGRPQYDRAVRLRSYYFYPRPPGGGRQIKVINHRIADLISIHALRVEGDYLHFLAFFLRCISIHALRVEGDMRAKRKCPGLRISIHALRVEGDYPREPMAPRVCDFYPRPPGGGRRVPGQAEYCKGSISIHALRVEGDRIRPELF